MTDVDRVWEALEKLIQMWTTGGCGSVNAVELGNQALTLLDGKVLVDEDKLRAILVIGFFASVPDEENRNIHIDKIINDLTTAEEAEND